MLKDVYIKIRKIYVMSIKTLRMVFPQGECCYTRVPEVVILLS